MLSASLSSFTLTGFDRFLTSRCHPVSVTGRSQHQNSDGRIFLIVKTDGHWIFLAGIRVAQTGLQWTLYDGLRLGHLVRPACCLALQFGDILQLNLVAYGLERD